MANEFPAYNPQSYNPNAVTPKKRRGCGCGGGCGGELALNQTVTVEVDRTTQLILLGIVAVQFLNFLKAGR